MVADIATVYRYDQRACGRSSGGPPYTVATAIADLAALREHWGLAEWIVAGHSWGASLALLYCLAHPARTRALIYVSGTGIDPAWHVQYRANQQSRLGPNGQQRLAELQALQSRATGTERTALEREICVRSWSTDFADRAHVLDRARQRFVPDFLPNDTGNRQLGADAVRWLEQDIGTMAVRLACMKTPTLIVHGEAAPRTVWAARNLAVRIPNAQLRILSAVGHVPWLEEPDQFGRILRGFLTALPAPESPGGQERSTSPRLPSPLPIRAGYVSAFRSGINRRHNRDDTKPG
jgi:proline iminopeptidase